MSQASGDDDIYSWKCSTCGEEFSHKRSLHRHIDNIHNRLSYACDVCEKVYSRRDNLNAHLREQHGKKRQRSSDRFQERWSDVPQDMMRKEHVSRHRTSRVESKVVKPIRESSTSVKAESVMGLEDVNDVHVSPSIQEAVDPVAKGTVREAGPGGKLRSMLRHMEVEKSSASTSSDSESEIDEEYKRPKKIKIGKEIPDLKMDHILPGSVVSVEETSSSTYFSGQTRLIQEQKQRKYNMVVLRGCDPSTQFYTDLHHVGSDNRLGPQMSAEELERAMIGRVTSIVETITKRVFQAEKVISEEEIKREYVVDMVVGTTKAQLN